MVVNSDESVSRKTDAEVTSLGSHVTGSENQGRY